MQIAERVIKKLIRKQEGINQPVLRLKTALFHTRMWNFKCHVVHSIYMNP